MRYLKLYILLLNGNAILLRRFNFKEGEGLFVHMKALRPDEDSLDPTHSVYVDQWDWEKVIPEGRRNFEYLKRNGKFYLSCYSLNGISRRSTPLISLQFFQNTLPFVHSEDLVKRYPDLSSKEREKRNL